MSTETEETAASDPYSICDGEVMLANADEFFAATGSIAAQMRDGTLFVLRRETMKWLSVEDIPSTKRGGKVVAIKGAN